MSITRQPAAEPTDPVNGETLAPTQVALRAGPLPKFVGKYDVLERLGSGAMGIVYKCRQPDLDRPVAVKVMLAGQHVGAAGLTRFQREARAASLLTHPNVVQIFDVGVDGEFAYFVMEYVDGSSLDRLIGTEWLTIERTLRLVYQASQALHSAHDQGVIHRDIKPSNILISKSGEVKLADFGLAKVLHESKALSMSGDLIGTPRYMSPEQVLAAPEEIDPRTDIYSLGAVMYEMLTGKPPVDGPNLLSVLRQLTDEEPVPIRELNPDVPEEVAALCAKALAKDREARFASAAEFAEAIRGCLLTRLLGRPMPAGSAHDSMLALALPPVASYRPLRKPARRKHIVWLTAAMAGLGVCGGIWLAVKGSGSPGLIETDSTATETPVLDTGELLKQASKQLAGALEVPEGTSLRERYKSILEDLTSVLKRAPENRQARLLRARAYRKTGEHLAAIEDLDGLLKRDPQNLVALEERLLASYELYVLYLGNLNERLLRPRPPERMQEDSQKLLASGTPYQRAVAALAGALSRQNFREAASVAESSSAVALRREQIPDWCMLESDAAFHAAAEVYAEELAAPDEEKVDLRRRRQDLVRRATTALRRGLDADPSHVGLLFLRANSFQRLVVWSAEEGDDHTAALNRQRLSFERTFDRLRHVTLRVGCDTAVARAVLLSNFDRNDPALEQITDALSCRPTVPHLYTLKAWLRMHAPTDGILTAEETDRILREFQPLFESPPDDFSAFFVRALLNAAAGRPEDARRDLRECRKVIATETIPTANGNFQEWFSLAYDTGARYLNATVGVLDHLPVPSDARLRLAEALLKRLSDAGAIKQEGLPDEDVQALKGWTHVRLAEAYAEKEDRARVFEHVREALALKVPDLTPQMFRDNGALGAWNEDEEFKSLYGQFSNP